MKKLRLLFGLVLILSLQACVSLKPYDRIYVRDPDMQMGSGAGKAFRDYVHTIREGAVPAGSVKASGGCGCN